MKPQFGDLPPDGQLLLTQSLNVDFSHCDFKAPRWFSAWARDDAGEIAGIFAVEFPYWFEGKVTVLVRNPRCMSRRTLTAIFTALFSQARRLTAEVEPWNTPALQQVQRMGWRHEGYKRLSLEGTRDTVLFGMLPHECRYLPGYVRPSTPLLDVRNRVLVDPVVGGDQRSVSLVGADQLDLFGGQRGEGVGFPDVPTFEQVGLASFPAEVVAVDAVPDTAGVRRVYAARGKPVRGDTDETMHFTAGAAVPHLPVSSAVNGKRPEKTIIPDVRNSVSKKTLRGHRSSLHENQPYE